MLLSAADYDHLVHAVSRNPPVRNPDQFQGTMDSAN
jgi:hypothetical protein